MSDYYNSFLQQARPDYQPPKVVLALDPGETTGVAVFYKGCLVHTDQLDTHHVVPQGVRLLDKLIDNTYEELTHKGPKMLSADVVVYENYRVYNWKAQQHSWDTLHTPRLIGAIQTLCHLKQIPTYTQMAQQPKNFCTDKKLIEWHYYERGQKHARDAIRHGCYYMLFNDQKPKK